MQEKSLKNRKRFDVALSFPGEYRAWVERVAEGLTEQLDRNRVFYDNWYKAELARFNLDLHLQSIYLEHSELIVVFLCNEYEKKEWCGLEWRVIRELVKRKQDAAIVPVRFDNAAIPGSLSIDGYIDATEHQPEELVSLIIQRLNQNRRSEFSLPSEQVNLKKLDSKAQLNNKLSVPPQMQTFRFECIEIKSKKTNSLLFRNKPDVSRQKKQAKYFVEKLGGGIELEMVSIPEGNLPLEADFKTTEISNSSKELYKETPINSFFISKYPITQAQWKAISCLPQVDRPLAASPSKFRGADHPIESISWHDTVEFCKRLSRKSGREYRLPTEIEWEYACRAGTTTAFYFGDFIDIELANYSDENVSRANISKGTTPVGHFAAPNSFGLYDMHGNVYEWCIDRWRQKMVRTISLNKENLAEGGIRVVRGGSWRDKAPGCRSSHRIKKSAEDKLDFVGFRVVCLL